MTRVVSELFDPASWREVEGFELRDITYHRAIDHGTVRIAFDRAEVRNAFRPETVDELCAVLDHARTSADVGCVLLTGNGPSPRDGGWAFCSGGDQRIRGKAGYEYEGADDTTASRARLGRLHILEAQRLIRFMPKVVICVWPARSTPGSSRRTPTSPASTAASGPRTSPGRSARSSRERSSSWVTSTTPQRRTGWEW
jgi:naphthoate synthase